MAYRNNRVLRRDWICFVIVVFDLGTLAQFARRPSRDGEVILGEHIEEDRYDSKFHDYVSGGGTLIGMQKLEL